MDREISRKVGLEKFAKIGYWLCFSTSILFLILIILSHYFAIKSGYDWRVWELSELVLYNEIAKILFNSATIMIGICLSFVLIPFSLLLQSKNQRIISFILSFITSICLTSIGIFSEDEYYVTHYVISSIFFVSLAILIFYLSFILLKSYSTRNIIPILGFLTFFSLIFHIITRWFFGKAYTQRICILFSFVFFLIISYQIIFKMTNINKEVIIENEKNN